MRRLPDEFDGLGGCTRRGIFKKSAQKSGNSFVVGVNPPSS